MSKITKKHQVMVEEHPSPLTVLLNPVPLCRHFLTHKGAETWDNERSYSAYNFMVHRTVSENPGAPGCDRQYVIWESKEGTAGSPLLWAHQLLLREETVSFSKLGEGNMLKQGRSGSLRSNCL